MAIDDQQGDVRLFQTDDDGDISVENGIIAMDGGLATAAYLSLWGGNEEDDASDGNPANWWGNLLENQPSRRYRSRTQYLTQTLPLTTANLLRVEDAAKADLQWFLDEGVATELTVSASVTGLNRLQIDISINVQGEETELTFVETWKKDIALHT